jgi:hypothetical protein
MKRAVFAVALVAASSGVASAGGYIGLGIGTSPAVGVDAPDTDVSGDGRSFRLLGGSRFGRFAIEGAVGKFDVRLADNQRGQPFETYQAQLAAKYHFPLDNKFEVFGKAGLHKLWFGNTNDRPDLDVEGSGWLLGGGFQYRFEGGIGSGALFVEYQYSRADVSGERLDWGATSTRMWTLGVTIGF